MNKLKKYISNYRSLVILLVAVCIALVVKKTFSANENVYTREELQKMVVSAAVSYYYNNSYSDYEQYLLDSDIKYPSVTTSSNNSCVRVDEATIKSNTDGACTSTSTNYKLYSTTFYRNTKITPEEVSKSNQYNVDCTGFTYLVYNNVLGYDLSEFYRLSNPAKYISIQKSTDENNNTVYSQKCYLSNSNKERYDKTVNKFGRVWNSTGNIVRISNCIAKNNGDRTKCQFPEDESATCSTNTTQDELNKYNNGGTYASLGRKYVDTSNKSEIVYSYIFKDGSYESQFDESVLPYFEKDNSKFLMQPGDMLDLAYGSNGHVMVYVGNALNENDTGLIHATGADREYDSFSVRYEPSIYDYLLSKKSRQIKSIAVYRPINVYCDSDTCTNKNITSNDKARVTFSGTKVEQYVQKKENNTSRTITKYNSVDVGDTIVYALSLEDKRNYGYCSDSTKTKSYCPTGEWKETGTIYDNETDASYDVVFKAPKGVTIKNFPKGYKCTVNSDKTTTCSGSGSRDPKFEATINSDATSKLSSATYAVTYKGSTLNLSTINVLVNNTINYNDVDKMQKTIDEFKSKNYTYSKYNKIESKTNINDSSITQMGALDYIKYIYYNTFNIDIRYLYGQRIIDALFYTWSESYKSSYGGKSYTYNPTAYFKKDVGTDEVSKMLVDGMYGGKKLIGNEISNRIKFIHPKYFEVGDIIVVSNDIIQYFSKSDNGNMNFSLTKIDPATDLKYYLVTGFDGEYTILTSFNENNVNTCGKESVTFSESNNKIKNNFINDDKTHICSFRITKYLLYSSNLFAVLRPSQLYNDISYNVITHLDDDTQNTTSLKYNDVYTEKISTPTKAGYVFDGWYYDKEFTNKATRVNTHTNHEIYAKYSIAKYTLTIDLAGGTYDGDTSIELVSGSTYNIPTVTREGYIFEGWEITGAGSSINGNTFTMGTENTTIKATWRQELSVTSDKYIVSGTDIKYFDEFNPENVVINYGTKEVTDNKLVIKYNNEVLKEYNLVKIAIDYSKYAITTNKILYFDSFDEKNITISNCTECTKSVANNKLTIKYNDKTLKEYDLVKVDIASNKYVINTDKILYIDSFDETNITINNCTECTKSVANNKLTIKYNDKTLKEYDLVKISVVSIKYIISTDKISYFDTFDENNITISNCTECTKNVENNKLVIKYNDKTLKEYSLVKINIEFNEYNVIDENILYFDTFDTNNVTINNCNECTKSVENNKLTIKYNSVVLKEYNLVKITVDSSKYIVNADKISYFDTFDESNITISNCTECTKSVDNNKLVIKYNDKTLKEYSLVKLSINSSKYIINTDKISYFDTFDENDININNCTECTKSINSNRLVIKYNDKTLKEYTLVKIDIEFNEYNVIDENLLHFNDFDTNGVTINNCTECTKSVENNKLIIKYKETILKSYNLLRINSEYKTNKNTIYVEKDSDEVILTKLISSYVDLSIDGDKLIVKYNDTVIKTFNLSRINETFDVKDYKVNNDKYIISGIMAGTNFDGFKSKIDTNVNYEIIDISGNVMTNEILKTGYKLKLAFSVEPMEYILSIKGDVLGEGTITEDGGKLIAKHIIDGNVIKGDAYLDAADYNSDGSIKMNDVIRMLKERS